MKAEVFKRYLDLRDNYSQAGMPAESFGPADAMAESDLDAKLDISLETIRMRGHNPYVPQESISLLTDRIEKHGKETLYALVKNDIDYFAANPRQMDLLEVIVQTDGSRPSFLITDGSVDINSSPAGIWGGALYPAPELKHPISCVGRINKYGTHMGTGFLIGKNLIMTNRHVLQMIANQGDNGSWKLHDDVTVDFGYELHGQMSINPRELSKVVYTGPDYIDTDLIDHSKRDIAFIALKVENTGTLPVPLKIDTRTYWAEPGTVVYAIGYPGNPGADGLSNYGSSILQELYRTEYGFKRLSPGNITRSSQPMYNWHLSHDTSTLAGSSGSLLIIPGREGSAAAIHYGGSLGETRENWAQMLSRILESSLGLRELLEEYEVNYTN